MWSLWFESLGQSWEVWTFEEEFGGGKMTCPRSQIVSSRAGIENLVFVTFNEVWALPTALNFLLKKFLQNISNAYKEVNKNNTWREGGECCCFRTGVWSEEGNVRKGSWTFPFWNTGNVLFVSLTGVYSGFENYFYTVHIFLDSLYMLFL